MPGGGATFRLNQQLLGALGEPHITWVSVSLASGPCLPWFPHVRMRGSARVGLLQGQACEVGVLTLPCTLAMLSKDSGSLFQEALRDCSPG